MEPTVIDKAMQGFADSLKALSGVMDARRLRDLEATRKAGGKFTVRLFDKFDGWIDVARDLSWEDALDRWNKETENGTRMTKYEDGDYWAIYPADTRMVMTPERLGR